MNVLIRRMKPEDIPQVAVIDAMSMPVPWSPRAYRTELETSHSRPWVAEVTVPDGPAVIYQAPPEFSLEVIERQPGELAVAGLLVVWHILDEAHIATIAVHPSFRRQKIARRLLRVALERAAGEGAEQALLEVRSGNLGAQALYRELGFEEVGRRRGYYRDNNEDALLMNLDNLQNFKAHVDAPEKH
jgi:ribosomal-protein-alanine N-acetyltransferase